MRLAWLFIPLILIAAPGAGAGEDAPLLTALRWTNPGTDVARVLTEAPAECLAAEADPERAWQVEVGRAAFRSPGLLGGEAARMGMTCESCHRNGRGNEDFLLPGLSGAPGTADVTSARLSSHREDGIENPIVIPDLGGFGKALLVVQARFRPDLEDFIRSAITEEFDGPPPPAAVLTGLAEYVRAMAPDNCPRPLTVAVGVEADLDSIERAVRATVGAVDRGDNASAGQMIEAARFMLASVGERYARTGQAAAIEGSEAQLGRALEVLRAGGDPRPALSAWQASSVALSASLKAAEAASFYDRAVLTRALAGS